MKIAIIGAGAIGSLVAGYLTHKKEEILLIARGQHCAEIQRDGLTIEGVRGKLLVDLVVKPKLEEQVDLAILATKTQDLEQALEENLTYLQHRRILTLQNGVRAEELIGNRLGKDNLFASIVMFGATYLASGRVVHNFEGDWIVGKIAGNSLDDLEEIKKVTTKIFPSPLSEDIMGMKWLKLFLNANNCLPAILGKSMQETFKNISVCKIGIGIWQEGWEIVNKGKRNLTSLPNFPKERISGLISMPQDESAEIFSNMMSSLSKEPLYGSILQSIKRGRPSEIDYINGEFVNLARSIGERAPLNERLVQMVHKVEQTKKFFREEELIKQTKEYLRS